MTDNSPVRGLASNALFYISPRHLFYGTDVMTKKTPSPQGLVRHILQEGKVNAFLSNS